jgi:hypothetical protein
MIGEIYDAALDSSRWQGVVMDRGLCARADATRKSAEAFYTYGIEPEFSISISENTCTSIRCSRRCCSSSRNAS